MAASEVAAKLSHVIMQTDPVISWAAAFWTRCSGANVYFGRPASIALQ
jgi:hypothetical protein